MKVVIAPRAKRDLLDQLGYLVDQGAADAALRLERRLAEFFDHTLCSFPRIGTFISHRDLWETWVPHTRLVVWYRFTAQELQIVRVWHTSQDRERA
jgi:plasmid stabilization system protein ParE